MYLSNATRCGVGLMIGTVLLGGCKKEAPQKAEVPSVAPTPKPVPVDAEQSKSGEALFKQHCAVCHPDGGNVIKPGHSLHSKHLKENNITKPEDIVKVMRSPKPGMISFDEVTVPDRDAMAIAGYVLKTFK